jgi:hypothetical protein
MFLSLCIKFIGWRGIEHNWYSIRQYSYAIRLYA